MRFSHDHRNGNRAAVLMATCLIVLMGAIGCAAIALAGDPEKPLSTLIPAGAAIVGIIFLVWILWRDGSPGKPLEARLELAEQAAEAQDCLPGPGQTSAVAAHCRTPGASDGRSDSGSLRRRQHLGSVGKRPAQTPGGT